MKITISPAGQLCIEGRSISLLGGVPVINQERIEDYQVDLVRDDGVKTIVCFLVPNLGGCVFTVEIDQGKPGIPGSLSYKIEDPGSAQSLFSFGLAFEAIDNLRAYFRNGYFSWDGSGYIEPQAMFDFEDYEDRFETGYAMTQLIPMRGEDNLILGFDRNDRFQHTFTFDTKRCPCSLTIQTLWDDKGRDGISSCESEKLFFFEHRKIEEGLRQWARLIAAASPIPPRLSCPPIIGWSSWYNLYSYISEEIILDQLAKTKKVVEKEHIPFWVFQVDDGFTPEMGDWLDVKPQFPHGMKYLMDKIRAAGFTPGLWIAPLMVGNRSRLFQAHPDWVVIDKSTMRPFVQWNHNGEYRWHKRSEEYYVLDTTHPDAFEYLRKVFRAWRQEWGCEYFKTDFMHFGTGYGPDEVIRHTPGKTRIEVWRELAEMIREEIGDAAWLGCGCPLWASIGLVDGIRISSDIGVSWAGNLSAESLLHDLANRNFANHILWQVDPDCILLRDQYHNLSNVEVRSLALYVGMSGGVVLTSDDLEELSPERIDFLKLFCLAERSVCCFPLLGQASLQYERVGENRKNAIVGHRSRSIDPALVEYRPGKTNSNDLCAGAIFIFNTGDYLLQRTYPLDTFGISTPMFVFNWVENQSSPLAVDRIRCTLQPHNGVLLFLSDQPFVKRPDRLP
jgi:alpha-galactosidase